MGWGGRGGGGREWVGVGVVRAGYRGEEKFSSPVLLPVLWPGRVWGDWQGGWVEGWGECLPLLPEFGR